MTDRLARIQTVTLALTAMSVAVALGAGNLRPLGIGLGGGSAALSFFILRRLAAAALVRRPPLSRVVALALLKSLLLVLVPAAGLLLPGTLVDGVSFAVGVSALPVAILLEAFRPGTEERPVPASEVG